jgi:lipid-A-disaccharide synthase
MSPVPNFTEAGTQTILLVAGETSGDTHGAELIRALREQRPALRFIGTGGARMAAAGQEQLFDLTEHAVVGLVEVAKHYPKLKGLFNQLLALANTAQPQAIVLIDFPGFNLRLAARLRKQLPKTKIIYYISPQVWAWKSGRAKTMVKLLDLMIVIFAFEKEWYSRKTPELKVTWVGHPVFDRILLQPHPIAKPKSGQVIALLPGSRLGELRKHLPILVATAKLIHSKRPDTRFVWIAPEAALFEKGQKILDQCGAGSLPIESYVGYQLSHLNRCDLALLASGTVSLECAVLDVPQIVFYKVNGLTYQVGKMVVKIKFLSMVNILANEPVVPEFVQTDLQPDQLALQAIELLSHPAACAKMQEGMRRVVKQLGERGASTRAAQAVLQEIPVS